MDLISLKEITDNPKLFDHLKDNSYYIKYLNRNPKLVKSFKTDMKTLYKERTTDKINEAIDGVEMISSIIDTIK